MFIPIWNFSIESYSVGDRIRWIRMFLDLPHPDPLVRRMDPDPAPDPAPDPSLFSWRCWANWNRQCLKNKKNFAFLKSLKNGVGSGSGSISQRYGSGDPDPHQNVAEAQHWSPICPPKKFNFFFFIFNKFVDESAVPDCLKRWPWCMCWAWRHQ